GDEGNERDEGEAECAAEDRGGVEARYLGSGTENDGGDAEAGAAPADASHEVVGGEGADGREDGGDAQAGEKIGQGGGRAEQEKLLPARGPAHAEKIEMGSLHREQALGGVHHQREKRDEEGDDENARGAGTDPEDEDGGHD